MASAPAATKWAIKGTGYEFCNCEPGCTCNFAGFPSSKDGSCQALIGVHIESGHSGDVDLSGLKVAGLFAWPKAIHEGGGKGVFVVPPAVSDAQVGALAQIFTGQLGGMPWEILGTTYAVAGLVRSEVQIEEAGRHSSVNLPGVGRANGDTLKNPVTGADNNVDIELEEGFIWKRGQCGQGSFQAEAEGVKLEFVNTSWIRYQIDWKN
jgi:hypothetical protein